MKVLDSYKLELVEYLHVSFFRYGPLDFKVLDLMSFLNT